MAVGQPVVSGNNVYFPPGTPVSVMNAYYAAVLRNRQIEAAQPAPWEAALGNFQTQVLNPYLSSWIQQPFQDYRQTYGANELIRGQQAQIDATTAALNQRAQDAYVQKQREQEAFGQATHGLLTQMEPRIGDVASDTGVTAPYGPYEDPQYTSPGPMFPDYNPYVGSVAPEAVAVEPPVAPSVVSTPERPPPQDLLGNPADWGVPAVSVPGQYAVNDTTGERWLADQGQWGRVGLQTAPTGGPGEDPYLMGEGPPPMPEEALFPQGAPAAAAPTRPAPVATAAPVTPSVGVAPTVPRSRFMGTTTVTPSFSDAMRLLAGIDPTAAGTMMQAIEKPNVLNALDPLRQDKLSADIAAILARRDLSAAGVPLAAARTDETLQKAEGLRVKNETLARVTEDFRNGRIGQEEWKIQMAAAHGKFGGGAGAAASGDTKTFITALATVMSDPENAGKTTHEYRELANAWLQNQAEAIERRKALGRLSAETGKPAAEQISKHTGYQQASAQLGAMSELVPRVDLSKIVGGIQPWLNQVAATGRTGKWGPGQSIPSLVVPEGMQKTLTKDETDLLTLVHEYADTVLRLKSGAQINEQEMERMLQFLPTDAVKPDVFRARLGTAFDNMDRWLDAFYRASHDYKMIVPEDSFMRQSVRRALKTANLPYNEANVEIFLNNPKNAAWLDAKRAPYFGKKP